MKKNLLIGLLILICGLFCVLGLAACKEEEETEEGGTVSVENVSQLIDSYGEQTKSFFGKRSDRKSDAVGRNKL